MRLILGIVVSATLLTSGWSVPIILQRNSPKLSAEFLHRRDPQSNVPLGPGISWVNPNPTMSMPVPGVFVPPVALYSPGPPVIPPYVGGPPVRPHAVKPPKKFRWADNPSQPATLAMPKPIRPITNSAPWLTAAMVPAYDKFKPSKYRIATPGNPQSEPEEDKPLKPVQGRIPTPFNHEYRKPWKTTDRQNRKSMPLNLKNKGAAAKGVVGPQSGGGQSAKSRPPRTPTEILKKGFMKEAQRGRAPATNRPFRQPQAARKGVAKRPQAKQRTGGRKQPQRRK